MIKKRLLLIAVFLITLPVFGESSLAEKPVNSTIKANISVNYNQHGEKCVLVKEFVRKDGVKVPPHYRTMPNKDKSDNWSSKGNFNPYTGKKGYEN